MTDAVRPRALAFAMKAHGEQRRKYTKELYIVHPINVAQRLVNLGFDDSVIAAAYLHDVLEDTSVTYAELEKEFGATVAKYVQEVTDESKPADGNRKARKQIDLVKLSKASPNAQSIKLADLIDNTKTIVKYDPNFAKVYLKEKAALLDVLKAGHPTLLSTAQKTLHDAKKSLNLY